MRTALLIHRLPLSTALLVTTVSFVGAAPNGPAESGLDKCQNTIRSEAVKYVQTTQKAIATCLGKVATEVLKKNASSITAAVPTCTAELDKIARADGRSPRSKFYAKVRNKCDPADDRHLLSDLLGTGSPTVAEPLNVGALDRYCSRFGSFASIDSSEEWVTCMVGAQDCAVRAAIAAEFPRAIEWLDALAAAMPPSPAKTVAQGLKTALDGAREDGIPDLQCGSSCGDGVKSSGEQCEGGDLGGATCATLGYAAGTLACNAGCSYDTSACSGGFPASGQTRCWGGPVSAPVEIACAGSGQDGDTRSGAPLAYVDNGDGTITDLNTGLMWEKKTNDGTLHDLYRSYPWAGLCSGDGATLCGRDADCTAAGGSCANGDQQTGYPAGITIFEWLDQLNAAVFAGHTDWRLPNIRELQSLQDLNHSNPAVSSPFNTNCGASSTGNPGCTSATCSCTIPAFYWSSSTSRAFPSRAWSMSFSGEGSAGVSDKTSFSFYFVRAVRGGS